MQAVVNAIVTCLLAVLFFNFNRLLICYGAPKENAFIHNFEGLDKIKVI